MITRIHHIQLDGNITCNNCYFLGQNSKVIINNNYDNNVTDSGEDDSDEHSLDDLSESLAQRKLSPARKGQAHQLLLRRRAHQLRVARADRILREERVRTRMLHARKAAELARAQRQQGPSLAAAGARVAGLAASAMEGSRGRGSGASSQGKLQRVEKSNEALRRAEEAIARSNDILQQRLAAMTATEKMFQVWLCMPRHRAPGVVPHAACVYV